MNLRGVQPRPNELAFPRLCQLEDGCAPVFDDARERVYLWADILRDPDLVLCRCALPERVCQHSEQPARARGERVLDERGRVGGGVEARALGCGLVSLGRHLCLTRLVHLVVGLSHLAQPTLTRGEAAERDDGWAEVGTTPAHPLASRFVALADCTGHSHASWQRPSSSQVRTLSPAAVAALLLAQLAD